MRLIAGLLFRFLLRPVLVLGVLLIGLAWWCNAHIASRAAVHLHDDMATLPHNRVGVVLGTSEKVRGGRPNLYFQHRIEAAAALYHAGKVDRLLLSGDNGTIHYNEPWAMRKALIAAGVDSTHITLDHAGFRTLDSMVRAREVFGQQRFTVISQRFHNERAVYLARQAGIDAIGFNARDVDAHRGFRTMLREKAARVKVFWDLAVGTGPRYLGEPVPIP